MSQTVVTFEDGKTALLRDPRQVPVRLRRPHTAAQMELARVAGDAGIDAIEDEKEKNKAGARLFMDNPGLNDEFNDTLILALVSDWGYGEVNQASLEDLPGSSYDALVKRCTELSPQLSPNFEVNPDPKVTTESSSVGEASSKVEAPETQSATASL